MKIILQSIAIGLLACLSVKAQEFKESVEPLSKKAIKGHLYDISRDESGKSFVTYKMKVDKSSEEVAFEEYSFDKDLKFLGSKDTQEKKEMKSDVEATSFVAYVGGTTSFDVLSMKLKLQKLVVQKQWVHEKQGYKTKKVISRENIKPKNDDGKVYLGYASYESSRPSEPDLFVLAKAESKDKGQADKFRVVLFSTDLEIKETLLELEGSHSLVFCTQLTSDDVVAVFAPNVTGPDPSKYVYFKFDIRGKILGRTEFKSPATALLITSAYEKDGSMYFFGTSTKSNECFNRVFNEYAPIYNPGYTEGGNNKLDFKWQKSLEEKMDNFHILKFSDNKLAFASTTPVADFKSKFRPAVGDKGATPYKGRRFFVESFVVTANEDYLIAGQLMGSVSMGTGNKVDSYEDVVCFHFDKTGALKAQYGLGKLNNDKKSEIFDMMQNFYLSPDGKSAYWEVMEVKGIKGYEGFLEAYYGVPSFYPLYYPRLGKIDLTNSTVGAFKTMGDGKYFLKRNFIRQQDATENSVTYFGHDDDFKSLWVGKMLMQ